jgi:hypothetical protein
MFRRKHTATVREAGFGRWTFRCTCGAEGRAIPQKAEIEEKARLHQSTHR